MNLFELLKQKFNMFFDNTPKLPSPNDKFFLKLYNSEKSDFKKGTFIPEELLSEYPNSTILPIYKDDFNVYYSKKEGGIRGRLNYLISSTSNIDGLLCYKYVCFSKFDTTHFVDILYTLYTEDINVNALKNDQKYYNALKNVLLDPKFLQNKKNLADHFGIKDTCYIGHLEKCVNPDTQISYYKKVAMSKDSEEKLLSSLSSKTSEQEKFKNSIAVSEDTKRKISELDLTSFESINDQSYDNQREDI